MPQSRPIYLSPEHVFKGGLHDGLDVQRVDAARCGVVWCGVVWCVVDEAE
jgi:hypothetical protein